MLPPAPPLDENRVAPPLAHSFVDGLEYTVVKDLLSGGGGATWAKVEKNFEGGNDKVVRSFDHIFNVESAEAQRRTPEPLQRLQLKPSNSTALIGGLLRKVVERLLTHIGGFAHLHHMTLAPVIVSHDTADQLDHTDTSRDSSTLPLADGQVSRWHLSCFLLLSSEYRIVVQAGSAYGEVSETRFDELHLTQGDVLVAASTCRHHWMAPTPQWDATPGGNFYPTNARQASPAHRQECNAS